MPVLPLDCHLPTQYTTHTITLQQWTNNKTNKSYKQLIYIYIYIYIHISHVNVTQTVPDISPLMPMHQYPLLVDFVVTGGNVDSLNDRDEIIGIMTSVCSQCCNNIMLHPLNDSKKSAYINSFNLNALGDEFRFLLIWPKFEIEGKIFSPNPKIL